VVRLLPAFRLLQLLPDSPVDPRHARDGSGNYGSSLGPRGSAGVERLIDKASCILYGKRRECNEPNGHIKSSLINLAFLVAGALIGPLSVHTDSLLSVVVHAQEKEKDHPAAKADPAPVQPRDPNVEYVQPVMSAGSALFGTLMAHRVAADTVIVNDLDLVKLLDTMVNILGTKGTLTAVDLRQITTAARLSKPLRVEPANPK
jgi:hypothetical protein